LAETTSVADQAVLPSPEQIARVERFTQERFVHEHPVARSERSGPHSNHHEIIFFE